MFPADWLDTGAMRLVCWSIPAICEFGDYLIADKKPSLNDEDRSVVYFGHYPSGTSLRSMVHYSQESKTGNFQYYDFGPEKNEQVYGQKTPPIIDIANINTSLPVALFVGTEDEIADPKDCEWANSVAKFAYYKEFNIGHLGFFVAKDMSYFTVEAMNLLAKHPPV